MKEKIIELLYKTIKGPYQLFFKKSTAWPIDITGLLHFPEKSLGYELGNFLVQNHFDIQPSLEEHDVYHVLTKTGTTVKDEIDMQFYLLGNGKRSPFVFIVITNGLLFYPFAINHFKERYQKGRDAHPFYDLDFYKMLPLPMTSIQNSFNIR